MNEFPFPPDRPIPVSSISVLVMLLLPMAQAAALVVRAKAPVRQLDALGWGACLLAAFTVHGAIENIPAVSGYRDLFFLVSIFQSMLALCLIQRRVKEPEGSRGMLWFLSLSGASVLTVVVGSVLIIPYGCPPEGPRRSQCRNNLKQIGLALQKHEDATGLILPSVVSHDGLPDRSWRVDLLPGLDERKAFEAYRKDLPWNSPENDRLLAPSVYRCPSSRQPSCEKLTAYAMVTDSTSVDGQPSGGFHQKLASDQSNSVCLLEVCGLQLKWQQPRDVDIARDVIGINLPGTVPNTSPAVLSSYHTGGANVLLTDGTVRFLSEKTDPDVLRAMLTPGRNNAEPVR